MIGKMRHLPLYHIDPMKLTVVIISLLSNPIVTAQTYPQKPVRIIVPTTPGGGTDLVGRVLAQNLSQSLGQQVFVDNRGGAGTTIGSAAVAKSAPDGYTLLLNHVSLAFNATYYARLPYDTLKDFAPISLVANQPFLLVAHPSLPVKSARELITLAKNRPGQIAYGSGGAGSGPHMGAELLKQLAQIEILHVPYKGAGPAFTDLIGGQMQMMIATVSLAMPHVKTERVRALAVTARQRIAAMPELATVAESGVPGYEFHVWYGLLAPAGTAKPIVTRLNEEVAKITGATNTKQKFSADGLDTLSNSPDEFTTYLKLEVEKWGKMIRTAGIQAN